MDLKLQDAGLLPEIKEEKLPEDITDDDGNLLNDCAEVSGICSAFLLHGTCMVAVRLIM